MFRICVWFLNLKSSCFLFCLGRIVPPLWMGVIFHILMALDLADTGLKDLKTVKAVKSNVPS